MFSKKFFKDLNTNGFEDELKELCKKYGFEGRVGSIRFTEDNATMKLELMAIGENGETKSKERTTLEAFYPHFADKEIVVPGLKGKAKVVGFNNRAHKFPFIIEQNGKQYKVSTDTVLHG